MDDFDERHVKLAPANEDDRLVQINTLGNFQVRVDGVPLSFRHKVPKKPLAVLKAVLALGTAGVCVHRVTDALWPDLEADAAHVAFNMALHRLRKLLRNHGAIRLQDARVSANPALCRVDIWEFERLAETCDARRREPENVLRSAFELYRGAFLADEEECWVIPARERLQEKFLRVLSNCCGRLEELDRWEEALDFYHQAIELNESVELFYYNAIRATVRLNRKAEGLALYHRLQSTLRPPYSHSSRVEFDCLLRQLLS